MTFNVILISNVSDKRAYTIGAKPMRGHIMEIVNASVAMAESYCGAVDEVAREGKWLSVNKGFSLCDSISFMRRCASTDSVQLFLTDGQIVAGWCDIVPFRGRNTGSLGIGLRENYRGLGWGGRLLDNALEKAKKRFKKIVLHVRENNIRAISLYSTRGFKVKKRYGKGTYNGIPDYVLMMVKNLKKKD